MKYNKFEVPCQGGTLIVQQEGDGAKVQFVAPDGKTVDEKIVELLGKKLVVRQTK